MRQLLGIDRNVLRPRLVEKDEYQGIARLGHCIAALARYRSGHVACVLRNDLAEAIALDGNLLSGSDLVVENVSGRYLKIELISGRYEHSMY